MARSKNLVRQTAKDNGDKFYMTFCRSCNVDTEHRVSTYTCKLCKARWDLDDKEKGKGQYNKEQAAKWRQDNKERIRKNKKNWISKPENKKKMLEYMNVWQKEKYKNDPTFRCFTLLRRSLSNFLKQVGTIKEDRTHEIVGYTPREYYDHLESLFQEGMTWDNQGKGGWEIDHIRPSSWFTKEQAKECFALSNLKPEWEEWNAWKSNRFEGSSEEYPMPKKVIKN